MDRRRKNPTNRPKMAKEKYSCLIVVSLNRYYDGQYGLRISREPVFDQTKSSCVNVLV